MFNLFQPKKNKELDLLITKVQNSMANNYKDMAQDYFKEFCAKFEELKSANQLNDNQLTFYTNLRADYETRLKGFTHKDQKASWK